MIALHFFFLVQRHGPGGDLVLPIPAEFLNSGQGEYKAACPSLNSQHYHYAAWGTVLKFLSLGCYWLCVVCMRQDYSVEGMSESLLTFLQHLREFGLVFQRKVCHWGRMGRMWTEITYPTCVFCYRWEETSVVKNIGMSIYINTKISEVVTILVILKNR